MTDEDRCLAWLIIAHNLQRVPEVPNKIKHQLLERGWLEFIPNTRSAVQISNDGQRRIATHGPAWGT